MGMSQAPTESGAALDAFLQERLADTQVESQGKFTVAQDKALEKLAAFRLPFPGAWALKIVQAAVTGGASSVVFSSSGGHILIDFEGLSWDLERLNQLFFQPQSDCEPTENHLLGGLWAVAIQRRRPFMLESGGQALFWDGDGLARRGVLRQGTRLTLSRGSLWKTCLKALESRAFTCPIPLKVKGQRWDSLDLSPHGQSKNQRPRLFGTLACDSPPLGLPQAGESEAFKDVPKGEFAGYWVLTGHFRYDFIADSKRSMIPGSKAPAEWELERSESLVYWVLDGVVIEVKKLPKVQTRGASIGLFLSAGELDTDLSGFALRSGEGKEARLRRLQSELAKSLVKLPTSSQPLKEIIQKGRLVGALVGSAVLGAALLAQTPAGLLIAGGAGMLFARRGQHISKGLERDLLAAEQRLRQRWCSTYLSRKDHPQADL